MATTTTTTTMSMTKAEKAAALAAARYEERKAENRYEMARLGERMAVSLANAAYHDLTDDVMKDAALYEAHAARVREANGGSAEATKALREAADALHEAQERRRAIDDAEIAEG